MEPCGRASRKFREGVALSDPKGLILPKVLLPAPFYPYTTVALSSSFDPERLRKHVPAAAWPVLAHWLRRNPVQVRVVPPRHTKLGDYRCATRTQPHRITVNSDLNKYAFLVTLVHEFAHHGAYMKHRRATDPHGWAWKNEYARLMRPFLSRSVIARRCASSLGTAFDGPTSKQLLGQGPDARAE